jgi:hypothetical protein
MQQSTIFLVNQKYANFLTCSILILPIIIIFRIEFFLQNKNEMDFTP